ncbi:MAG: hypothetical protein AB7P12_09740 [Alphaproteobacteria bacterium]
MTATAAALILVGIVLFATMDAPEGARVGGMMLVVGVLMGVGALVVG